MFSHRNTTQFTPMQNISRTGSFTKVQTKFKIQLKEFILEEIGQMFPKSWYFFTLLQSKVGCAEHTVFTQVSHTIVLFHTCTIQRWMRCTPGIHTGFPNHGIVSHLYNSKVDALYTWYSHRFPRPWYCFTLVQSEGGCTDHPVFTQVPQTMV
jgi:hypothetical protein